MAPSFLTPPGSGLRAGYGVGMTVGELLERTRAGGAAHAELVAARGTAGSVRFTGTCDFARGLTTLERDVPDLRPLWVTLDGDEVGRTAGGEPEERHIDEAWAGHDLGRSGVGLLGLLDDLAAHELPEGGPGELPATDPAQWVRALVLHVTGIPLPNGRRVAALRVAADAEGRLGELEVTERRLLGGAPRVTHTLRLTAWR